MLRNLSNQLDDYTKAVAVDAALSLSIANLIAALFNVIFS